jgi:biotin carboxylase
MQETAGHNSPPGATPLRAHIINCRIDNELPEQIRISTLRLAGLNQSYSPRVWIDLAVGRGSRAVQHHEKASGWVGAIGRRAYSKRLKN